MSIIKIFSDTGVGNQIQFIPVIKKLKKAGYNVTCDSQVYYNLIPNYIIDSINNKHKYDYGIVLYSLGLQEVLKARRQCAQVIGFPFTFKITGHKPIPFLTTLFYSKWFDFNPDQNEIINNIKFLSYFDININAIDYSIDIPQNPQKDVIGISAGSGGHPQKRWNRWCDLIDLLGNKVIRLFGTEIELNNTIKDQTKHKNIEVVVTDNLREAAVEIGKCEMFISNDNGLMHLADIMKVPLVSIFGMTEIKKNSPWNKPNKIVSLDLDCSPCYTRGAIHCTNKEYLACMDIEPTKIFEAIRDLEKLL